MITYYIHGHGCMHNLIHGHRLHWTDPYYNYLSIVRASRLDKIPYPHRIVYAVHDFVNPEINEYQQTCENFQMDLVCAVYHPYIGLTPEECLAVQQTFDWRECPVECLLDTNNYYYKTLYTRVESIISWEDWCAMVIDAGAYRVGEEYLLDPDTLETLPRPPRL